MLSKRERHYVKQTQVSRIIIKQTAVACIYTVTTLQQLVPTMLRSLMVGIDRTQPNQDSMQSSRACVMVTCVGYINTSFSGLSRMVCTNISLVMVTPFRGPDETEQRYIHN